MCPEKERWKRIAENDIDKLEKRNKRIILVKRYVWDQENYHPFSHELRPQSVLEFTLNYILYYCLDLCDHTEHDKFYFLNDRTRSIRQDIEHQDLRSPGVAELIEKCTRFHIHSIYRFIADEAAAVLNEVNMENLSDCLQLLFRVYDDLYSLLSNRCLNEAEFRAYRILLNLNEEKISSSVLLMHTNIQQSNEIEFALRVHISLTTSNYEKFFELLSNSTYMSACIMLRYFTQIRKDSLKLFISQPLIFSRRIKITELTKILAFEDIDQCKLFIDYCGLKFESDDNAVYLNAADYKIPDMPFILNTRPSVVDNKRRTSVVEAVCGMNMFEYQPVNIDTTELQNSFDEEG